MNSMNRCDLIMIALFISILIIFGLCKYIHYKRPYDELDKKVDGILNKQDPIIKPQQKTVEILELPKNFFIEDYRIPEFRINSDGAAVLSNEVKNTP